MIIGSLLDTSNGCDCSKNVLQLIFGIKFGICLHHRMGSSQYRLLLQGA